MFGLDRYNGEPFQVQNFIDNTGSTYTFLQDANDAADDYNNNMGYWIIDADGIVAYYPGVHVLDIPAKQAVINNLLLQLDAPEPTRATQPAFELSNAYPNPFNGTVAVAFTLPAPDRLTATVHDLMGRRVALLHDGSLSGGMHTLQWSPERVASGMYLVRVHTGRSGASSQRIQYLK